MLATGLWTVRYDLGVGVGVHFHKFRFRTSSELAPNWRGVISTPHLAQLRTAPARPVVLAPLLVLARSTLDTVGNSVTNSESSVVDLAALG